MSQKIRVLVADTFDPWFNLATEDWIFRDMDPEYKVLFLWRNQNTVVIGRFQNPWTECNVERMNADEIKLARRQSGGGAVFHDLGNTNFTFMASKETYDKNANNQIIINALKRFGIESLASGRNDLVLKSDEGEKKFSGSAFKETKERAFHHGTLLINADLSRLGNYLNPNKKKLESKGIKSVVARVTNLSAVNSDVTHESLSQAIIEEFFKFYGSECEIEHLDYEYLKSVPALNEYYEKLKDWNWRFGETPKFTHFMEERFVWGGIELHLNSHKGLITEVQIYTDSLHPEMIEILGESLKNLRYERDDISRAIGELISQYKMYEEFLTDFRNWLCSQIN
ncbi:lipoate--protein ligase [Bacteriovorax sp. Seq25_V]|uniref:lipoate--protein ligase n=1 Tax=Bacteriovorax sp. Seq25_V TaxID=1201288 RepID=UPI00038A2465|nr:lipoate--protein ligase [Bacteriovorax sp. Seq25_V]EQC46323.1 lipoyltransferase and lipoate-protein ligase [Bacteriovorax sp. Seq25_V]